MGKINPQIEESLTKITTKTIELVAFSASRFPKLNKQMEDAMEALQQATSVHELQTSTTTLNMLMLESMSVHAGHMDLTKFAMEVICELKKIKDHS